MNPPNPPLAPIHPSVANRLDPAFVKVYNSHFAHIPPSVDHHEARFRFSEQHSTTAAPASGVGGIGETPAPGWSKYLGQTDGQVDVRVYVPPGEESGSRKVWPVHFNFHGGGLKPLPCVRLMLIRWFPGWVAGDLETDARICHHICANVPCCVIDINYRLVPEFPFPIGIMDALSAVSFIVKNPETFMVDTTRMTLGGTDTGGTIALVLNHMLRDAGKGDWVKGVVVGTPAITDIKKFATAEESPYQSMREFEYAPFCNWANLKWLEALKSQSVANLPRDRNRDSQLDMAWCNDLVSAPNHAGLAPLTWIGVAECDPLRDEAELYAEKLRESGNKVITKRYKGVPHTFMHMDKVLPQGQEYVQDMISHIRECLCPPS